MKNSEVWKQLFQFFSAIVKDTLKHFLDEEKMGNFPNWTIRNLVVNLVGHTGSILNLFQFMKVEPKFVGANPLFVHERKSFLKVFDSVNHGVQPITGISILYSNNNPGNAFSGCSPIISKDISGGVILSRF